ncbi:retinal pigment epithelial membrane protein [Hirsutella rhossiliensis]|uniref:Retinal pigment epithelial membrane protein n=1 Tax=Hirsutella rhossiliensis TaxID=111463 RepID=A0A9P8SNQ5_9HYPO|nr:retinal pigment epithelial membrane protein [Hirsutella rhossiliensis]KAH0967401.1 retinal pigment epithelial membrane protein [Hirsutella rhossiliensis]
MAVNAFGVVHRTAKNEKEDKEQIFHNIQNESWKDWPNHAGFEGLEEHRGPLQLSIKGTIPAWAAGSLYRTGPGQSSVEDTSRGTHYVSHWFDGFAHTHKFDIIAPHGGDGETTVVYSSRRQSEDHVAQVKKAGWRSSTSFGQRADPCVGIFSKFMSLFVPRRLNNNVACLPNFPGLPANGPADTKSGHRTGEIDPDTLEPLGFANQQRLHPDLQGVLSCAHAQQDAETGDWFNFNLALGRLATYRVFRVNAATGTTDVLATISDPDLAPAYIHSFFLTENYVVLCIPSSHFGWNGVKILWERNLVDAIKPFDRDRRCQWVVVDRKHGRGVMARFSTPAAFFFHSVNAFEEHVKDESDEKWTDLCLDHTMYDNADIMFGLYYDVILDRNEAMRAYCDGGGHKRSHSRHVRYRFRMPVAEQTREEARSATAEEVFSIASPHSGELSNIHPERMGRPYRYVYGTSNRGLSTFMDSIVKTDLETREAVLWSGSHAHTPGEPVFVPRPGATDEDDGVVLSVVLDGTAQKSYLLCLDARTMEETGRAEADFPIALGFHGFHAPARA